MKVQVKEIVPSQTPWHSQFDPNQEIGTFDVKVEIGNFQHQFKLAVDIDLIGERQIQIVRTDDEFEEIFKFDLQFHRDICKLVSSVYNHQPVQLPTNLGELEKAESLIG
ncbi:hypothetical protein PCC7424_5584 (plasmid) [Gloeothece citriformis PCC 7424]|uniref:Uncharacterized protein n=1 Tax=Gloeothece citriformis (strain PCC 7424) TaxID=65393 RepID=B7KMX5_GLOC7|nr:hypothetical protein [Gloeothece citriformis]ACK74147.1 hypothetical protein PCC7424_5584 [Gloeothece citriformis PCC 7424]